MNDGCRTVDVQVMLCCRNKPQSVLDGRQASEDARPLQPESRDFLGVEFLPAYASDDFRLSLHITHNLP